MTDTNYLWYSGAKLKQKETNTIGNRMADSSALKQIVENVKNGNTVLVTVNANPSVDELSAALGITLLLNKLNKHATAVFSGNIPPAIEFLNPEKTFENTVDSLRDFIIALDKEKADHLRYKVVDDMVKIFITPYRTTINQADLDFSQGDYNVETVLTIGVKSEEELDRALESHGRILHDATIGAISLGEATKLGGVEWADADASSYSEMLFALADHLKTDKNLIDEQIANAFLTGIVAATDRFSNNKTTSKVMTVAAQLMSAGANQQLIATKLEEDNQISTPATSPSNSTSGSEGELREGQSTKIESPRETQPAKKEAAEDESGALSISHLPEGDVDEVSKQVATRNSKEALWRAQEELTRTDNTETAEQRLANQLAATAPPAPVNVRQEIESVLPKPVTEEPLRGAVSADQWKTHSDQETPEPSFGGTLNATTEQAEADKRRQIEDDRNRTILTHGGSYTADTPSFQSPLNATAAITQRPPEPTVPDIFAKNNDTMPTERVEAIQPPEPVKSTMTLAEIDAKNRKTHNDARDDINEALKNESAHEADDASRDMPTLPPLPPMPDFSTLPQLPGEPPRTNAPIVPDSLGDVLPPAPTTPAPASSPSDPGQFRIPGQ